MRLALLAASLSSLWISGCAPLNAPPLAPVHLSPPLVSPGTAPLPPLADAPLPLPRPDSGKPTETYSISVQQLPVRELLLTLARDAHLNLDVHPDVDARITLQAENQTLPQILKRIARQLDLRWDMDGETLVVQPDTPFLRSYRADYVNLSRQMHGTISTNTQIATGSSALQTNTGSSSLPMGGNLSTTRIENQARNQFWDTLERNIQELLRETDKLLPEGTSETITENQSSSVSAGANQPASAGRPAAGARRTGRSLRTAPEALATASPSQNQSNSISVVRRSTVHEAAAVIVHRESGVITVRATSLQHEKVQEFLDRVLGAAHRQVMIEATILEVALSDGYRQGIDWTRLFSADRQLSLASPAMGGVPGAAASVFSLGYANKDSLETTIRLLESFGTVKVLSSPKLAVLNNQTAVIKVVEEFVYFTVRADTTQSTNSTTLTTVSTTPQAVSVGLVMSITPQISPAEEVILNIRPTISSISDFRRDPNPNIPATIPNLVPQIRTREIESLLRLGNGETAVLGGLMEDRIDHRINRVPVLGATPALGELFTQRDQSVQKTELVIFLRPRVVNAPQQLAGGSSLPTLPGREFFQGSATRKGW